MSSYKHVKKKQARGAEKGRDAVKEKNRSGGNPPPFIKIRERGRNWTREPASQIRQARKSVASSSRKGGDREAEKQHVRQKRNTS